MNHKVLYIVIGLSKVVDCHCGHYTGACVDSIHLTEKDAEERIKKLPELTKYDYHGPNYEWEVYYDSIPLNGFEVKEE